MFSYSRNILIDSEKKNNNDLEREQNFSKIGLLPAIRL
jgi:hypothetical protein